VGGLYCKVVGKMLKTLSTYGIFRRLCSWWIYIASPLWREECPMALATSPLAKEMKTTPFMYPHAMATWALSNSYVVLSTIWHVLFSLGVKLDTSAYCYYTRAICTIGFCLTKHTSPFTSAVTAIGGSCVQHYIPLLWRNFAIWRESFSPSAHFNTIVGRYLVISQYPNMLHLNQTNYHKTGGELCLAIR